MTNSWRICLLLLLLLCGCDPQKVIQDGIPKDADSFARQAIKLGVEGNTDSLSKLMFIPDSQYVYKASLDGILSLMQHARGNPTALGVSAFYPTDGERTINVTYEIPADSGWTVFNARIIGSEETQRFEGINWTTIPASAARKNAF